MQVVCMPYELSQKYRLVARTAPEIYYGLNELITRFAARDSVQFRGRKLGVEAVLNAIALNWLALPEADQLRVIREGVARFEQLLGGDDADVGARKNPAHPGRVEGDAAAPDGYEVNAMPPPVQTRRGGKSCPKRGPKAG